MKHKTSRGRPAIGSVIPKITVPDDVKAALIEKANEIGINLTKCRRLAYSIFTNKIPRSVAEYILLSILVEFYNLPITTLLTESAEWKATVKKIEKKNKIVFYKILREKDPIKKDLLIKKNCSQLDKLLTSSSTSSFGKGSTPRPAATSASSS